jgi:hypothetical protein
MHNNERNTSLNICHTCNKERRSDHVATAMITRIFKNKYPTSPKIFFFSSGQLRVCLKLLQCASSSSNSDVDISDNTVNLSYSNFNTFLLSDVKGEGGW